MKALIEKRNDLIEEMEGLVSVAKTEVRALATEELTRVEEIRAEIKGIDATLRLEEETRSMETKVVVKETEVRTAEEVRAELVAKEERSFVDFIKGDTRALTTAGQNGVTIPLTIANRIIDTVKNLSPILSKATMWNVKGDFVIPAYDYTQHLPAGYATELTAITAVQGTFSGIKLTNAIVVSLALISKSLINRTDIDVVPFIVNEIAKAMAYFLEKELLNNNNAGFGQGGAKLGGLPAIQGTASQKVTSAATLVIAVADLVKTQMAVPQVYQGDCAWIMSPATLAAIQSLQASGASPLLMGYNLSQDAPFTLLGKPVYISDNMPTVATTVPMAYYGDFSGLHVKMTKEVNLQVLNERFADQYAIGVIGAVELDATIVEPRKMSVLVSA